jgi:uncharacterized repeat protein (TIGR04138 family)
MKESQVVKSREVDWPQVRGRAAMFPEEAFEFVRDGLKHTVTTRHGPAATPAQATSARRHVTGQELCLGLKDLAVQRWGLLTPTVFRKWGLTCTEDFGAIVYAMIDRRELKASEGDSIEDFRAVFDFDEAFGSLTLA